MYYDKYDSIYIIDTEEQIIKAIPTSKKGACATPRSVSISTSPAKRTYMSPDKSRQFLTNCFFLSGGLHMITSGMLNHMSLCNSCRSVGACLYIDVNSMNTPSICSPGMSCAFRLGKVIGKYVRGDRRYISCNHWYKCPSDHKDPWIS